MFNITNIARDILYFAPIFVFETTYTGIYDKMRKQTGVHYERLNSIIFILCYLSANVRINFRLQNIWGGNLVCSYVWLLQ